MEITCKEHDEGLTVKLEDKKFDLLYPKDVWKNYPREVKDILVDNLTFLLTMDFPLVAGVKKLKYNTSSPIFKPHFRKLVIGSLPGAAQEFIPTTGSIIKQFLETNYEFSDSKAKLPSFDKDNEKFEERAILSLACGKDSLLSLGVCKEIGLNPISVYTNETIYTTENKIKIEFIKKLAEETKLKFHVLINEVEKLNDYDFWKKTESCVGYSHVTTGICFSLLPFSHFYKSKYIVLGNQQNMNFGFINKDGYLAYPSFDQTAKWMKKINAMIKKMSGKKVGFMSVIEPLTNIAIMRILHNRYHNLWKYEVSCDYLDVSTEKRWCHNCPKCTKLFILMKANGIDTKGVGLRNLLDKKYKNLYCLFAKKKDLYESSKEAKDEQLLAFYMAYKNGAKGYMIDLFKKKFLKEAVARQDELFKKFFSIHKPTTMPRAIRKNVIKIYKEELKNF